MKTSFGGETSQAAKLGRGGDSAAAKMPIDGLASPLGPSTPVTSRDRGLMSSDKAMTLSLNPGSLTTQAAEGLPRRRFTVCELEQMVAAGILAEHERLELIGGEVVPMSPKGDRHELVKAALTVHWARRLPADLMFVTETTFRLTPDTYLEPDFVFYLKADGLKYLGAGTAKLVVEVSDPSLGYDLGRKALLYAGFGIAELWVIDAVTLHAHVHREPGTSGYGDLRDVPPGTRLEPLATPKLSVTLGRLALH